MIGFTASWIHGFATRQRLRWRVRQMASETMTAKELSARIAERVMGWRVVHYVGSEKVEGYVYPFNHNYEAPDGRVRNDVPSEYSFWSPATKIEHAFEMEAEIERQQLMVEY